MQNGCQLVVVGGSWVFLFGCCCCVLFLFTSERHRSFFASTQTVSEHRFVLSLIELWLVLLRVAGPGAVSVD